MENKEGYLVSIACIILGSVFFLIGYFGKQTWLYFGASFFIILGLIDLIRVSIHNYRLDSKK